MKNKVFIISIFAFYFLFNNLIASDEKKSCTNRCGLIKTGQDSQGNDVNIFFKIDGNLCSDECIFLIHGIAADHRTWNSTVNSLGQKFKIVRIDLRGFGNSSKPQLSSDYTWKLAAEDVKTVIETLKLKNITLIGNSLGGSIAMQLAIDNPELIKQLVLSSTTPQWENGNGWDQGSPPGTFNQLINLINADFDAYVNTVVDIVYTDDCPANVLNILKANHREMVSNSSPAAQVGFFTEFRDNSLLNQVESIEIPSLILRGKLDITIPKTQPGVFRNLMITNGFAFLYEFVGKAHHLYTTSTIEFSNLICRWINNLGAFNCDIGCQ